jgi:hypothetical protein
MADGPDGTGDLTAMSTDATFSDYPGALTAGDTISSIVADPGGADALWLTDETANAVERVALQPPTSATGPSGATGQTTTAAATNAPAQPPAPALAPVSAVLKSGATFNGTITLPPGSPPTAVSYQFEYGTSTAYGSSTPTATITAASAGVPVSAVVSGLDPFTTYHYRLVANDCATSACQGASSDQSFTTGSTLAPVQDTSVGAAPTSGEILIRVPGQHGFKRLAAGELIPIGTTVDARGGVILIQSAIGSGEQASGRFSGGIFEVTQPKGGTVTVLLLKSSFLVCPAGHVARGPLARAASARKKAMKRSHKTVNQVFGNAHGQFATQGHYATAADQGTAWSVADRCDGTRIAVSSGKVGVTDFLHHRTFVLTAGHHYLAAPN